MGEVYRATDTKLGRDVALKLLPKAFAADPERLARFEREARLLASLNHPNIAQVYGFESATLPDGSAVHFLAMELVEGEDLAERLKRGAVPVDEALAIARQIAEALEEAHEHGIVHRDLKPANVKLTEDGKAKVLDFGLAKFYGGEGGEGSKPELSQFARGSMECFEPARPAGVPSFVWSCGTAPAANVKGRSFASSGACCPSSPSRRRSGTTPATWRDAAGPTA